MAGDRGELVDGDDGHHYTRSCVRDSSGRWCAVSYMFKYSDSSLHPEELLRCILRRTPIPKARSINFYTAEAVAEGVPDESMASR